MKIQEGLDLIIEHYITKLREARLGGGHTIPDRYALTILEDTEAIRNYVKPVLADRIRELDEQVPKIRIEDLTAEIEGKEGKISPVWHTGAPTEEGCYLLRLNYANLLFDVAFLKDGKFKSTHNHEIAVSYILAWQSIDEYKEESNGKISD